jgi:putative oxidoreductase
MNQFMSWLDSQKANGYLILRVIAAIVLIWHGYGKLFGFGISGVQGFFESVNLPLAAVLAPIVSILEFFGGIAILLGIFTRLLGIWMMVQFGLIVIWIKPVLMNKGFSGESGSELDFLLFGIGLLLVTNGAGIAALGPKLLRNMHWAE